MCLFGCKCEELVGKETENRWTYNRYLSRRITILEKMFKDTKEYKKAECEVLRDAK